VTRHADEEDAAVNPTEPNNAKSVDGVHIAYQVYGEHELKGVPDRCLLYRVVT
jgi:hypothetical protein